MEQAKLNSQSLPGRHRAITAITRALPFVLLALAIVLIPRVIFRPEAGKYQLYVLVFVGINTILAVGLNLLMGYAGQVSLGHAAFYGLGAYASAILTTQGVPKETTVPGAIAIAVLAACVGIIGLARATAINFVLSIGGFILSCALITHLGPSHWLPYTLGVAAAIAISYLCRLSPPRLLGAYLLGGIAGAGSLALLRSAGQAGSISPWTAMLAGILFTSLIAYLIGVQALRLQGYYLAMATLGFGFIIQIVFLQWEPVTGGTSGIYGISTLSLGGIQLDDDVSRYYFVWGIAFVVMMLSANIINSRVGRAFRAVHGSEIAASTLGVDTGRYKLQVFVLSAALASIAGSLYAHFITFISPEPFGFKFSVELVVMVVIGGLGSIWGAIFGAAAVTILGQLLQGLGEKRVLGMGFPLSDLDVVVFGLILMLIMIFMPSGLARGLVDLGKPVSRLWRREEPL